MLKRGMFMRALTEADMQYFFVWGREDCMGERGSRERVRREE